MQTGQAKDSERISRVRDALADKHLDALVCALPSNVLMLSGYWPVIGNALALITREGFVGVAAPDDEQEFALRSWADEVRLFTAGSLDSLEGAIERVCPALSQIGAKSGLQTGARLGFEGGCGFDPAGYAAAFYYGAGISELLTGAIPHVTLRDATGCLARLRAVLTAGELQHVRQACSEAREAFSEIVSTIHAGMREYDIAAILRRKLASGVSDGERADSFTYCMSGPNSAQAYAAFQQSRSRAIGAGDFVLLHCNSCHGGFWTDITRTFSLGPNNAEIIEAVLDASREAMKAVRPGIKASEVDSAAREVLTSRGFGKFFKHGTGHGVGFAAIDHHALPRIHPLSGDVLEEGMVFNIEPAVYIAERGGMRHCDMVAVTRAGAEHLTPFLGETGQLLLQ